MGAQDPDNKAAEGTEGQEANEPKANEPKANEPAGAGTEPQGGEDQEGNDGDGGRAGEGGKSGATVNRHKYERDLAAKDKRIAELQAQIDEAAKTKEGRDDLQKKLDDMKAELDGEKVAHKLELAGCVNGIIPACAGNTPRTESSRSRSWDHPRVCGEHSGASSPR